MIDVLLIAINQDRGSLGSAHDEVLNAQMPGSFDSQSVLVPTDDQRQLARIGLAPIGVLPQPGQQSVRKSHVDAAGFRITPRSWATIDADWIVLTIAEADVIQLIRRSQICEIHVAMKWNHRVREVSETSA